MTPVTQDQPTCIGVQLARSNSSKLYQIDFYDCMLMFNLYASFTLVSQTYRELIAGYRSPPPPGCTRGIYKLMMDCW